MPFNRALEVTLLMYMLPFMLRFVKDVLDYTGSYHMIGPMKMQHVHGTIL